jgi:hypothetical protein
MSSTKRKANITWYKCCYCCLNTADKVNLSMKNFDPMPVCYSQTGQVQLLIGKCQPSGAAAFCAPSTNMPCVYYKLEIQEERKNGDSTQWKTIFNTEQFADFYICDVNSPMKIWVQGSNPGFCKRASDVTSARGMQGYTMFGRQNLPPGITNIVNSTRGGILGGWIGSWGTNNYRYYESSFDVGEDIAVLSRIGDGMDPYSGQPIKVAQSFLPTGDFF